MNLDSNMETDRILRRYAQQKRDASKNVVDGTDESVENNVKGNSNSFSHLDPDELSAYAENALPAAARARYTAHLADCDSCRKLITELVLSSGAATELEANYTKEALSKKPSWQGWLGAMFAPRVLRYAASIVIFLGVAAIALIVFRGGRDMKFGTSTSQTENGSSNQDVDVSSKVNNPSQQTNSNAPSSAPVTGDKPKLDSPSDPSKDVNRDFSAGLPTEGAQSGQDQKPANPAPPGSVPADIVTEERDASRDRDSNATTTNQPAVAGTSGEKIDAKKEAGGGALAGRIEREAQRRNESDEVANTAGARAAASKSTSTVDESSASSRKARRKSETPPKSAAPPPAIDDRGQRVDKAGSAAERRTVNGKQFMRRDGAWVDVAYRSQATTNVKRGGDQYRALMADEPGLRSIANQLGGEVIVVWNGRAYRIH